MGADSSRIFGKLLVKAGLFTEPEVEDLLQLQKEASERGETTTLGEICLSRGLLTARQVKRIEEAQAFYVLRQEDRRIGELAVSKGLATAEQVGLALEEQKRLHEARDVRRLGEILVDMRVLSRQQLSELLTAQDDHRGQLPPPPAAARGQTAAPPPEPAEGEEPTGWLVQETGEGTGARFPLARKAVLGRQPHNEVPLADEKASREHARIEFFPHSKQHVVFDLSSTNGTLVNGQPLSEPRALLPKDKIQIGETVLRYEPGECVQTDYIPPGRTVVATWTEMAARATSETEALRRKREEVEPSPPPAREEPSKRPSTAEPNGGCDSGTWMPGLRPQPPARAEEAPAARADRGGKPGSALAAAIREAAAVHPPVVRPPAGEPPRGLRILALSLCAALLLGAFGIAFAWRPRPDTRDAAPQPNPNVPTPVSTTDPGATPRANEAMALSRLKALVAVEAARKEAGKDYLVDSVWSLYYGKDARGDQLRLVAEAYARADLAKLGAKATPYQGYYFSTMRCDENGIPFENLKDRRFAFCASPAKYEPGAVYTFIAGESGVVWRKDLSGGGPVRQWPASDPLEEGWVKAD